MAVHGMSRRLTVPLALMLVALAFAGLTAQPVGAANFSVSVTLNDANAPANNSDVIHPGCAATGTGTCSLRDAVLFANSKAAADTTTITLPAGTYTLTIIGTGENAAATGDLDLNRNVILNGAGAGTTIIQASLTGSATGIDRLVDVGPLTVSTTTISGMTIRYGNPLGGLGGAIVVKPPSALTLNDCIVTDNATSSFGGGIFLYTSASLTANRVTVSNNTASAAGAGGIDTSGTTVITNSTISGNHGGLGGGLYNGQPDRLTLLDSTVTGNVSAGTGGGLMSGAPSIVTNSIIAGNSATGLGQDVNGAVHSGGHNLIGKTDGSSGWVATDLQGTIATPLDAHLGPLQNNGGPTPTHALLLGSPAVGGSVGCPAIDQRGLVRPATVCAIGAVEPQPGAIAATTGTTPQSIPTGASAAIPLAAKVSDSVGNALPGWTVIFGTPSSGAGGTFAGGIIIATTNASGVATAPTFIANNTLGTYQVTASVVGVVPAIFSLTNIMVPIPPERPGAPPSGGVPPAPGSRPDGAAPAVVPPPTGR